MPILHKSVLLQEVLQQFYNCQNGIFIDATLGYAGHSEAMLQAYNLQKLIGIDRDQEAIDFCTQKFANYPQVKIFKGNFASQITNILSQNPKIDGILADIGVSSSQLDKKERGFSFDSQNLDMRMDTSQTLNAKVILNTYSQSRLEQILIQGEVVNAHKIAQAILVWRAKKSFQTTKDLKKAVESFVVKKSKINPYTLLFQALRIEVNNELNELKYFLQNLKKARLKGTRVGIISFHSLEDRIIKQTFKNWAQNCICSSHVFRCECGANNAIGKILTKKPISATPLELKQNTRSRSAKLRMFEFYG